MEVGKIDFDTAVLAGLCSDRYLLTKAVDDGFGPELLSSTLAKVVDTALLLLRQELDYKSDEEYKADFHGFAKVQELFALLAKKGYLPALQSGAIR